ncbi:MAG: hypothetical protein ACT4OF_05855 [Caulobacteraceae bacterium]
MRSKRGAAHVKGIDPRQIDAAAAVTAASWIMAEFIRLFHVASEADVQVAMASLMRSAMPIIEQFGEERVVTVPLPCEVELLLLIFDREPEGMDRRALGLAAKHPPSTITETLKRLEAKRFAHKTKDGRFHITGPGELFLADKLAPFGFAAARSAA